MRQWIEALWAIPVYLLALFGVFVVPRRFAALAVTFLLYETVAAWGFAGATSYRVAFALVPAVAAISSEPARSARWRARGAATRVR